MIVLTGLGFLCLGLGAVGLLIPLWPTTPFVIASAACFTATPRLRAHIMGIGFFKEHIQNYENRTGLSRRTVLISLIWLWSMLLLSAVVLQQLWVAVLLLSVGTGVTGHILWMARAGDRGNKR